MVTSERLLGIAGNAGITKCYNLYGNGLRARSKGA
jgi:hypothetical protein